MKIIELVSNIRDDGGEDGSYSDMSIDSVPLHVDVS